MAIAPTRHTPAATAVGTTAAAPADQPASPGAASRRARFAQLSRRLWWMRPIITLVVNVFIFAIVAFFLVKLIPGDALTVITGGRLDPAEYAAAQAQLGLDQPVFVQLLDFLGGLARLDLGTSISTGRPIALDLSSRVPATLELVTCGLVASVIVAVLLSYLVVTHRRLWVSRALTAYARSAGAIPEFVIGIAFLFLFYAVLHWAPAPSGRISPLLDTPPQVTGFPMLDAIIAGDPAAFGSYAQHLVLPVIVMVCAHSALIMKMVILSLDEAIDDPATKFRIASGASRRMVVFSIFRRASPPTVATIGMLFGMLLGGALVLEALFGLGGLGQYAVDAVNSSDIFALRSFLFVVAVMCLVIYLVVDLVIMIVDPRRRPGVAEKS